MRLKNYGRNQKKRKEYIHQSGLLLAQHNTTLSRETFEKCSILFKVKEGENLSADASLRVTGGIH